MKIFGRRDRERRGPEGLWHTCRECGEMAYEREFEMAHKVCPKCGFHERLSAPERIALLLDDPEAFVQIAPRLATTDPLKFERDGLTYPEHLARYQQSSGLIEAVICGKGRLDGAEICLAVIDFRFLGASMGAVVGEKITLTVEAAMEARLPLVIVNCSGGARMQEGMLSLMQMAKTSAALRRFHDAGLLYISVMTDPTLAGVTASFASLADVIVAEPGATIGFTGRRLIEQIVKQKLPEDAQSAEFMQEHGMVDLVSPRRALKDLLGRLLNLYTGAGAPVDSPAEEAEAASVEESPEGPEAAPKVDESQPAGGQV
ncbi:MAG: acetyl-CoA carboxylase, carboxyltransferase subunit beta [Chloroflexota bacterium]|nr:acetyl-CoA carboxylase, carboxyltransferase subunit beta [Chloroflexota bacterium]MDP6758100.1 acetyl-CoA carboxylase, carboxyltransferase subunit beta [Chloroflexota bacterium]